MQSISCLRPVSFSSVLAATIDALLLSRCRSLLEAFWGPCQSGGVHEALVSVLALTLLSQLRLFGELPLLLLFVDLASAFDVANRNDMPHVAVECTKSFDSTLTLLLDMPVQ